MSKGLEALERLWDNVHRNSQYYDTGLCNVDFRVIEKELKASEIIKSKPWLVNDVVESKGNYDVYKSWCNTFRADMKYRASEEEYNLLKEVLL